MANLVIETYEIEEVTEGLQEAPADVDAEAMRIAEVLGLKGQATLVKKNTATGRDERCPFPEMSRLEYGVYKTLFPQHDDVKNYSAGIIPLRVLKLVSAAKAIFPCIEVWHDKVRNPYPVAVGCTGPKSDDQRKFYMLARWGEALKPFAELEREAQAKAEEKIGKMIEEGKSDLFLAAGMVPKLARQEIEGTRSFAICIYGM
jgi:hypothetical protein